MTNIKRLIRDSLRKIGFNVTRCNQKSRGLDPFIDMKYFLENERSPLILDIGANIGQSVDEFKMTFPDSFIHSFEPSPTTYDKLCNHCNGLENVKTWNFGIGAKKGILPFKENDRTHMSSFLSPGNLCWGNIDKETEVEVLTLDSFVNNQNIDFVHILKSDTQGYDFEVLKGAEGLMNKNRIGLIYFEFIFSEMYQKLPLFSEVFQFLIEHNFAIVSFYKSHFQQDLVSWTDVMFINMNYNQKRIE